MSKWNSGLLLVSCLAAIAGARGPSVLPDQSQECRTKYNYCTGNVECTQGSDCTQGCFQVLVSTPLGMGLTCVCGQKSEICCDLVVLPGEPPEYQTVGSCPEDYIPFEGITWYPCGLPPCGIYRHTYGADVDETRAMCHPPPPPPG